MRLQRDESLQQVGRIIVAPIAKAEDDLLTRMEHLQRRISDRPDIVHDDHEDVPVLPEAVAYFFHDHVDCIRRQFVNVSRTLHFDLEKAPKERPISRVTRPVEVSTYECLGYTLLS